MMRSMMSDAMCIPNLALRICTFLRTDDIASVGMVSHSFSVYSWFAMARFLERDLADRCTGGKGILTRECVDDMPRWLSRIPVQARWMLYKVDLCNLARGVDAHIFISWWNHMSNYCPNISELRLENFLVTRYEDETPSAILRELGRAESFRKLRVLSCSEVRFLKSASQHTQRHAHPLGIASDTEEFEALCDATMWNLEALRWNCNVKSDYSGEGTCRRIQRHANALSQAYFLPIIQSLIIGDLKKTPITESHDADYQMDMHASLEKLIQSIRSDAVALENLQLSFFGFEHPLWKAFHRDDKTRHGDPIPRLRMVIELPGAVISPGASGCYSTDTPLLGKDVFPPIPLNVSCDSALPMTHHSAQDLSPSTWDTLCNSPWTPSVVELTLERNFPTSPATSATVCGALPAASTFLDDDSLDTESLSLPRCPQGFANLALSTLSFSCTWFNDDVLTAALKDDAHSTLRRTLRCLRFHGPFHRDSEESISFVPLFEHPWHALEELYLWGTFSRRKCLIDDVISLIKAPQLLTLSFSSFSLSDASTECLLKHLPRFPLLHTLDVHGAFRGGDQVLLALSRLSVLSHLRTLNLRVCGVTVDGLNRAVQIASDQLPTVSNLSRLEMLSIRSEGLGRRGLESIWTSRVFSSLRKLVFHENGVTKHDLMDLLSDPVVVCQLRSLCEFECRMWNLASEQDDVQSRRVLDAVARLNLPFLNRFSLANWQLAVND
eukprot:ANDGO_06628.mRNA.1 hypothetical protein